MSHISSLHRITLSNGRLSGLIVFCLAVLQAAAAVPDGYYDAARGLATDRLKTALHEIIYPHTKVTYSKLPNYFKETDVRPATNFWWDMYSNLEVPTNITFGTYMNREHSFPKSWWGGKEDVGAYTDLFHLYPAEAKANQAKSNWPLGIVKGTPTFDNTVCLVGRGVESGGADKVFEPADEYKGDFARSYFYVVTAYQNLTWAANYQWMVADGAYPTLRPWAIELLLEWHRADPVSEKELTRNEAVYAIQGNRNPFIDYPDLAEYIWGNLMGQTFIPGEAPAPGEDPALESPAPGSTLDFGRVALGRSVSRPILFRGRDLAGSLEFTIVGPGAQAFAIEQPTLSAEAASSPSGVYLTMTFTPSAIGEHEASLIIQDGGLDGSIVVGLRGEGAAVPELQAPVALPAERLGDYLYTALWEQPGDEPVDYWNVAVTSFRPDGETITRIIPAETTSLTIDADPLARYETYSVTACALGCESAPSNTITVATGGIIAPAADAAPDPLDIVTDGHDIIVRAPGASIIRVFDSMGRLIDVVSRPAGPVTITLPAPGIYILSTDLSSSHRRIIVR